MRLRTLLIAPNAFKGSLRAMECARAMAAGARDAVPDVQTILHPLSDGGDGLVEVLADALEADLVRTEVSGPLPDQRVEATWAMSADRGTAIIEMASAAGLIARSGRASRPEDHDDLRCRRADPRSTEPGSRFHHHWHRWKCYQ